MFTLDSRQVTQNPLESAKELKEDRLNLRILRHGKLSNPQRN